MANSIASNVARDAIETHLELISTRLEQSWQIVATTFEGSFSMLHSLSYNVLSLLLGSMTVVSLNRFQ